MRMMISAGDYEDDTDDNDEKEDHYDVLRMMMMMSIITRMIIIRLGFLGIVLFIMIVEPVSCS